MKAAYISQRKNIETKSSRKRKYQRSVISSAAAHGGISGIS
jgi:hypothetical protein